MSQYVTGDYEFVTGDPTREPQPDDMVYAKLKVDTYGRAPGRPKMGEKVETRLPDDVRQRVDDFAKSTSRSRADAPPRPDHRGPGPPRPRPGHRHDHPAPHTAGLARPVLLPGGEVPRV
ncbi:hypothetical protein AB0942_32410 [Streptomyces nodosus]|uniref:hypothetical protein n=1 Tax=Streptomyces nodosus TaxID=40318 RepID=UPI0034555CB3